MKFVLADVRSADGLCRKEAGCGFGERLRPISRATRLAHRLVEAADDLPSPILARLAGVLVEDGHTVIFTRGEHKEGDVAIVRSSLVDFRNEIRWASEAQARGLRVAFVGVAASQIPDLFASAADLVIYGEPETIVRRLARGERIEGLVAGEPTLDWSSLPRPRWDLAGVASQPGARFPLVLNPGGRDLCAGCPHAVVAAPQRRSLESLVGELVEDARRHDHPTIVIADPGLFEEPELVHGLSEAIRAHRLPLRLECEARLARVQAHSIEELAAAGLETLTFVEPCDLAPTENDPPHEAEILALCARLGMRTIGSYVLGGLDQTWDAIAAVIDRAISRGTTLARFRMLTPYPGTMLHERLKSRITETDWEHFDGFGITFRHPHLTDDELAFLLAAAHAHFYLRPSFLARLWRLDRQWLRGLVGRLDGATQAWHSRRERAAMSRTVVIS